MKWIKLICFLMFSTAVLSQQWEWVRNVNGLANDYVSDIFVDDSANVYIAGRSKFAVTFEDPISPIVPPWYGHTDAFAAKYDKNGNLIWANQIGGSDPDWAWGIVADNYGNAYFTGQFADTSIFGNDTIACVGHRDVFISKINNNGNFVWTKTFGGTLSDKGQDIELDNAGNVYVTGWVGNEVNVEGTVIGTNTIQNGFVAKLDSAGNFINVIDIAPAFSSGFHLKSDDNGFIYLAGETRYDNYFGNLLVQGPVGYIWGDAFLAKLDTSLQTIWVKTGSGNRENIGESIAISDNYVYLTGCFSLSADFSGTTLSSNGQGTTSAQHNAGRDIFIAKYDFSGNLIWVKGYGGIGYDYAFGIDVTPDDYIYVGGIFQDTVNFDTIQLNGYEGNDDFFVKLDTNGTAIWAKGQGGSLYDACYAVAIDKDENLYAGGTYRANDYFDTIYVPTTQNNGFIGKITQHTYPNYTISDTNICIGDTIMIIASGITSPLNFASSLDQNSLNHWFSNDTIFAIINSNTTLSGTIVISNTIYSDSLNFNHSILINSPPSFSLGADTIICDNDSLTLEAPPQPNTSFLWSNNDTTDLISVNQSGTYWLIVENVYGCQQLDTIEIGTYNTANTQFHLGNDTTLCDYDSLTLLGPENAVSYSWSTSEITSNIIVNQTDAYWLNITDTNNCNISDTITVNFYDTAGLLFTLGADTSTCDYNSIDLSGPQGNFDYLWNTTEITQDINATTSGIYFLTITDLNQCTASDTITINYTNCASIHELDTQNPLSIIGENIIIAPEYFTSLHCTLYIYNTRGQILDIRKHPKSYDFSKLPVGVYIAALATDNTTMQTLKFIKQ